MMEILIRFFITDRIVRFFFSNFVLKFGSKRKQLISILALIYGYFLVYQGFFIEKSFYQNLGLSPSSSEQDIKKSYR